MKAGRKEARDNAGKVAIPAELVILVVEKRDLFPPLGAGGRIGTVTNLTTIACKVNHDGTGTLEEDWSASMMTKRMCLVTLLVLLVAFTAKAAERTVLWEGFTNAA